MAPREGKSTTILFVIDSETAGSSLSGRTFVAIFAFLLQKEEVKESG